MKKYDDYILNYESLGFFRRTLEIQDFTQENLLFDFSKRFVDIFFSLFALAVFSPVSAIIYLVIKITSPGPVFFSQRRAGKDGSVFFIYKFRSMKIETDPYEYSPEIKQNNNITTFGKFLRASCLDEIPQFFNVLTGDMSIVGPRPEMEFIAEKYSLLEKRRLSVKPGITGIWQLKASRKQLIHENLQYDLEYIENISLGLDLKIMLLTVWFIIKKIIKYEKGSLTYSSKPSRSSR